MEFLHRYYSAPPQLWGLLVLGQTHQEVISPVASQPYFRKHECGRGGKITQVTKEKMENLFRKDPCLTEKQLKGRKGFSGLATVSIRKIQDVC